MEEKIRARSFCHEAKLLKARIFRSKDVRKLIEKLRREGWEVSTEEWYNHASKTTEHWTRITGDSFNGLSVSFNWTVGRDEYDDKATHVWAISC